MLCQNQKVTVIMATDGRAAFLAFLAKSKSGGLGQFEDFFYQTASAQNNNENWVREATIERFLLNHFQFPGRESDVVYFQFVIIIPQDLKETIKKVYEK